MSWTEVGFETTSRPLDVDPCCVPWRIHVVDAGDEEQVDARCRGDALVARPIARVGGEIGWIAELAGVDEHAGHHDVALLSCRAEQGDVTVVKRAHRGYEPDYRPSTERFERPPKVCGRAERLHGAVT